MKEASFEADINFGTHNLEGSTIVDVKVKKARFLPSNDMSIIIHGNYFGHLSGLMKASLDKGVGKIILDKMENIIKARLTQALYDKMELI
jgi:hypothetical protein